MAHRLNDDIIAGCVINNTERNSIHGHIHFKNHEFPLILNLTGNCTNQLAGRHLQFSTRENTFSQDSNFDRSILADQQIGPPGTINIDYVRWFPGSIEQAYRRAKLGEPPPMYWKPRLYFEWYSQNGRVLLELVDPILTFLDDLEPRELTIPDPPFADPNNPPDKPQLEITEVSVDEDENIEIKETTHSFAEENSHEDNDPYNLFENDIDEIIKSEAESDFKIEPDEETKKMFEQMDIVTYGLRDEPVCTLFDPPIKLPKEETLSDEQIDDIFHELLMRMAMLSIALDMCKHYTPRKAYKLLTETLLKEGQVYPGLPGTGYVQHYMTHEFCEECDREIEEEYRDIKHGE